jgi:hypothetical protein
LRTHPRRAICKKNLIDEHETALHSALEPWSGGVAAGVNLLHVEGVASLDALAMARIEFKPSYVHLLAHGALTPRRVDRRGPNRNWGLRLGSFGEDVPPEDIAKVLAPVSLLEIQNGLTSPREYSRSDRVTSAG